MGGDSVALSGGGHRASLFGLGALMAMVDSGAHADVTSIASVSGGSLTNGWLAHKVDLPAATSDGFRAAVRPFVQTLANKGTFLSDRPLKLPYLVGGILLAHLAFFVPLGRWERYGLYLLVVVLVSMLSMMRSFVTGIGKAYGALIVPTAMVALTLPFVLPLWPPWWSGLVRMALVVVALALWVALVFSRRGAVCRRTFTESLFPTKPTLIDMNNDVDHIFCATELQTGDPCYFSRAFVYGYLLGVGSPANVGIVDAVSASAALPGAFSARKLDTGPLDFHFARLDQPRPEDRPSSPPTKLVLADGGVYDNMGDEWAGGFDGRATVWPGLNSVAAAPDRLIVVNASAGLKYKRWTAPPVLDEIVALKADEGVLYDQTTSTRRRSLVASFDAAELLGKGLRGVLVHITQSPFDVADHFAGLAGDPDNDPITAGRATRGVAVRAWLTDTPPNRHDWRGVAREDSNVKTTLAALGVPTAGGLLYHGYVLAAANMHVVFGTALPPLPLRATFEEMAAP